MGGSTQSKANATINTTAITKIIQKNIQDCSQTIAQSQQLVLKDVGGDININHVNMEQIGKVDISCFTNQENIDRLATDIKEEIKQQTTAEANAMFSGLSNCSSKVNTEINQLIEQSVDTTNLQDCAQTIIQKQGYDFENVSGDVNISYVDMKQTAEAVAQCSQFAGNLAETITKIENILNQESTAISKGPLDTLFEAITSLFSNPFFLIALVVVAIVVFIIIIKKKSGGMAGGFPSNVMMTLPQQFAPQRQYAPQPAPQPAPPAPQRTRPTPPPLPNIGFQQQIKQGRQNLRQLGPRKQDGSFFGKNKRIRGEKRGEKRGKKGWFNMWIDSL